MNKKSQPIIKDRWVPIRIASPGIIMSVLLFLLPNSWWGIIIKSLTVIVALISIVSAYQIGESLGYKSLSPFAFYNIILLLAILFIDNRIIVFICGVVLAIIWINIYTEGSRN